MPADIFRGSLGEAERKKYGEKNWYDWSLTHWGTKWNAYDIIDDNAIPTFHTAWGPPTPVFAALSLKFPKVKFDVTWNEEGGTSGEMTFLNGEMIKDISGFDNSNNEE